MFIVDTQRTREDLFDFLTPAEKKRRYTNHIRPTADQLRDDLFRIETTLNLGDNGLLFLPTDYTNIPEVVQTRFGERTVGTHRRFKRYADLLWLSGRRDDPQEAIRYVVSQADLHGSYRGFGWNTVRFDQNQQLIRGKRYVLPSVCLFDGLILYFLFQGKNSDEIFARTGLPRERIEVRIYGNSFIARVPSRSRKDARTYPVTWYDLPTISSPQRRWIQATFSHDCGDETYNREIIVGSGESAIDDHTVASYFAIMKHLEIIGDQLRVNILPIPSSSSASFYGKLINQIIKDYQNPLGTKGERNLSEAEKEEYIGKFHGYAREREQYKIRTYDQLFSNNLDDLEQHLITVV